MSGKGNEEFFSFDEDNMFVDSGQELDDENDNEYHQAEYAVGTRYT